MCGCRGTHSDKPATITKLLQQYEDAIKTGITIQTDAATETHGPIMSWISASDRKYVIFFTKE